MKIECNEISRTGTPAQHSTFIRGNAYTFMSGEKNVLSGVHLF